LLVSNTVDNTRTRPSLPVPTIVSTRFSHMSEIDELIYRWSGGDEIAAEAIYTQSRGAIYGLAYALLDNSADAEEVTQDVLA